MRERQAEVLRRWRKEAGLTQKEAGAALGLSQSAYSYLEAGRSVVRTEDLRRLSAAYGRPLEAMISELRGTGPGPVERLHASLPDLAPDLGRVIWMTLRLAERVGAAPLIDLLEGSARRAGITLDEPPWLPRESARFLRAAVQDPERHDDGANVIRHVTPPTQREGYVEHVETIYEVAPAPRPVTKRKAQ